MKIIELELLSNNIKETENFYKKTLGLDATLSNNESVVFTIGFTKLIFKQVQDINPVYHFAIDIPGNRFDEAYNFIKATVALLEVEPGNDISDFKNWDAKSFYFYDNNGNLLELIARYGNNVVSDVDFSSDSLVSISEIGLVTDNVPKVSEMLTAKYNVPVFYRQPKSDAFTVNGDDNGLFIIVIKGREWYPTHVKSAAFYTRVLFLQDGIPATLLWNDAV